MATINNTAAKTTLYLAGAGYALDEKEQEKSSLIKAQEKVRNNLASLGIVKQDSSEMIKTIDWLQNLSVHSTSPYNRFANHIGVPSLEKSVYIKQNRNGKIVYYSAQNAANEELCVARSESDISASLLENVRAMLKFISN